MFATTYNSNEMNKHIIMQKLNISKNSVGTAGEPYYLAQTDSNHNHHVENSDDGPRTAEMVHKPDLQTVEGVKLTFIVPNNETESTSEHLDGLVVQHVDENQLYVANDNKIILYHDKQCLLSVFLYFTIITSFVYLAILWIKQRMLFHLDHFQFW